MVTQVIFLFNNNIPTWADDDTGNFFCSTITVLPGQMMTKAIFLFNNNIPTWADDDRGNFSVQQ